MARLAFVEMRQWVAEDGKVLLVPSVLARTEVIQHRVIVSAEGQPLEAIEDAWPKENGQGEASPGGDQRKVANRAFWQRLIDEVSFDHPDQPKPRHGGNNWVRIPLPDPAKAMTAYRSESNTVGFFFSLAGQRGADALEQLRDEQEQLATETGLPIRFEDLDGTTYVVATLNLDLPAVSTPDKQLVWLKHGANALVTALRPRFSHWKNEG